VWIPRARRTWLGRAGAAALLAITLLGGAGSAAGASPAVGVVTVTVVDDETHAPLAGADVSLTGFVSTAADPVYEASKTATAAGTATFADVPLTAAGDPVSVSAEATLTDVTKADGCTITQTWSGAGDPVPAAHATTIDVAASREESAICTPPGPDAPVLRGTILGPDGLPFVPERATVSMHRGDGGTWDGRFTVDPDGSFSTRVEPWGTVDEPADLVVHVTGVVVGTETDGDCTYDLAPDASLVREVALAGGADPAPISIVADISRVAGVCGTTGTPAPTGSPKPTPAPSAGRTSGGAATPTTTLPPTDRLAARPGAAEDGFGMAARSVLLACVGAGIALAAGLVRRSR
jgi:hypothetical protein